MWCEQNQQKKARKSGFGLTIACIRWVVKMIVKPPFLECVVLQRCHRTVVVPMCEVKDVLVSLWLGCRHPGAMHVRVVLRGDIEAPHARVPES